MTTTKKSIATVKLDLALSGLPSHDLTTIEGWNDLDKSEQVTVKTEVTNLDKALIAAGTARLRVGEHLYNIREVLEPKRLFTQFLNCCTTFSKASAYRYIDMYTAARNVLPETVMNRVMLRGMDRINLEAVRQMPPPRTTNVTKIDDYLSKIERHREPANVQEATMDDLKKRFYHNFRGLVAQIPVNTRLRTFWMRDCLGMALTELGFNTTQTISPVAIPDSFVSARGRPRKEEAA